MKKILILANVILVARIFSAALPDEKAKFLMKAFEYEDTFEKRLQDPAFLKFHKGKGKAVYTDWLVVKYKDNAATTGINIEEQLGGILQDFHLNFEHKVSIPSILEHLRQLRDKAALVAELTKVEKHLLNLHNVHLKLNKRLNIETALELLNRFASDARVEYAYFAPAIYDSSGEQDAVPLANPTNPDVIPNFYDKNPANPNQPYQFYLDASPVGINARAAWNVKGGTGAWIDATGKRQQIRVADVESGWHVNHIDLNTKVNPPNDPNGNPTLFNTVNDNADHGTAVWGEIAAKKDGHVKGIIFEASYGLAGVQWMGTWDNYTPSLDQSLHSAISSLSKGDLLVIEQQAVGPEGDFIPVEYWPATYDIIKAATASGIFCVAAAGNGSQNLDDPAYGGAFDFSNYGKANLPSPARDSGCIIVGAGGAPDGEQHLQRLSFSNYGTRVDAFAYGEHVVTTGYGDLYGGTAPTSQNQSYTAVFNGTSSATPIVSGATGSLASIARANQLPLTNQALRAALRTTGTPQEPETGEGGTAQKHIGNLPDLCELNQKLFNIKPDGC